jgi:hypothetical protein
MIIFVVVIKEKKLFLEIIALGESHAMILDLVPAISASGQVGSYRLAQNVEIFIPNKSGGRRRFCGHQYERFYKLLDQIEKHYDIFYEIL